MSGNARGASSAFCLLFRLAQLKPTEDQVQELLDHGDSPYIRAVGNYLWPGLPLPAASCCRLEGRAGLCCAARCCSGTKYIRQLITG